MRKFLLVYWRVLYDIFERLVDLGVVGEAILSESLDNAIQTHLGENMSERNRLLDRRTFLSTSACRSALTVGEVTAFLPG